MYAKVILANPERGLYAAQVSMHGRISIFELVEGSPLKIGDIVRGSFGYTGNTEAVNATTTETIIICIIASRTSPVSAHSCIQGFGECRDAG